MLRKATAYAHLDYGDVGANGDEENASEEKEGAQVLQRTLPIEVSAVRIRQHFESVARKRGFTSVQCGGCNMLAIRKPKALSFGQLWSSLSRMAHRCIPHDEPEPTQSRVTVLRLGWAVSSEERNILLKITALSMPEPTLVIAFVHDFAEAIAKETVATKAKEAVACSECGAELSQMGQSSPYEQGVGHSCSPVSTAASSPHPFSQRVSPSPLSQVVLADPSFSFSSSSTCSTSSSSSSSSSSKYGSGVVAKNQIGTGKLRSKAPTKANGRVQQQQQAAGHHNRFLLGPPAFADRVAAEMQEEEEAETLSGRRHAKLEAACFLLIRKILCSDNYSLGKLISQSIEQFEDRYADVTAAPSYLSKPMEECMQLVETTVDTLLSEYNFGRESAALVPFVRPAVEKYFFNKLYDTIFPLYRFRFEQEDQLFVQRCKQLESASASVFLEALEIKRRYWLIPTPSANAVSKGHHVHEPYYEAVRCLQKIDHLFTPREKLDCVVQTFSLMRACVVDFWKGKVELVAMDDELPVFIFIVVRAGIHHVFSDCALISEFLGPSSRIETEGSLITTLRVAAEYVAQQWLWCPTANPTPLPPAAASANMVANSTPLSLPLNTS